MADPTTPSTPVDPAAITKGLDQIADAQSRLTTAQQDSESVANLVSKALNGLENAATKAGVSLNDLGALSQQQTEAFALFAAGAVKARTAFEGFAGVDYSGLSTFTEQINDIKAALFSGGTAASGMGDMIEGLSKKLLGMGATQGQINDAKSRGAAAVLDLASNTLAYADNMNRLQTATIQMAGKTGELGDIYKAAGTDLRNMSDILEKQQTMLDKTRQATGLSAAATEKWYNQLGLIPGALKETVVMGKEAGDNTSMLTAVIQTATAAGRDQADVMKDLKTAFQDFGIVGENALRFSVRMHDISTRLKAPIEDVTNSLRGSADAFKMFATGQENASKSAESLANTLNVYGKALESTGLSATAATEVAGNLSNQVAKLTTGQLAFISQQRGGPGGLMGAAQETLKLQSDPGAVVADAMKTLQQQFGRIVTVQEAATSEAAASQNIKQTTMLQQLLGPLAKDQPTANRLLEAMKNTQGRPEDFAKALSPTGVKDAAAQGMDIQKKTFGVTSDIRNMVEQIRDVAARGSSGVMDRVTAAGTNKDVTTFEGILKAGFAESMKAAQLAGGPQVKATALGLAVGTVKPTGGADAAANIHGAMNFMKEIPLALMEPFKILKEAFSNGDTEAVKNQEDMLRQMIASQKEVAKQTMGNPAAHAKAMDAINSAQIVLDAAQGTIRNGPQSPAQRVGNAAHAGANRADAPGAANTFPGPASHAPGAAGATASNMRIEGKITIDCPHCGRPHDASHQIGVYQVGIPS